MLDETHRERILVVDDVETNVRLISGFLKRLDVEAVTATTGPEALELLECEAPDLVLLDVMMPGMDGFEVLARIRENPQTAHIPVIMVTALSALQDKVRCQEAGADDFVSKPFDRTELLLRVKSMLRIKQLHDQLAEKVAELEVAKARLKELAETDDLTGLFNKRYFSRTAWRECERAKRTGRPFAVALCDLDHFKRCNDTYGHPTGDEVLRQAAERLAAQVRVTDTLARYGGEEFIELLLETDLEGARTVTERQRRAIEEHTFLDEHGKPIEAQSASIGVAVYPEDGADLQTLIKVADRRLYLAKEAGRNRAIYADSVA